MNICLVIENYPPNISGGVSVYGQALAQGLAKSGNRVTVLTTGPCERSSMEPQIAKDGPVSVIRFLPINIYDSSKCPNVPFILKPFFHLINLWNPFQYFIIKKILKSMKPDVIHIHDIVNISLSLVYAVKSLGIPMVLTLHSYSLLCRKVTLLRSSGFICTEPNILCSLYCHLTRKILGNIPDVVTAPSQFVLDLYSQRKFFPKSKRIKVTNAIKETYVECPQKHHDGPQLNILYIGFLEKHKGIHILINAVRKLPFNRVRLNIVGEGGFRKVLENLAGRDQRIIFHGSIPKNDLPFFYCNADITVVPSIWYEVAGLVIQESLMAGTPVVASRIGGMPEYIEDGFNGILFDPGNVDELAELLLNLFLDRSRLEQLRRNALKSLKPNSMDFHVEEFQSIYSEAIRQNVRKINFKNSFANLFVSSEIVR